MSFQEIIYEVTDGVATVTLNRPEKLNAWTLVMEGEVRQAMTRADENPEVRVIVLTGAGRGFCSGMDMGVLQAVVAGAAGEDTDSLNTLRAELVTTPLPGASSEPKPDFMHSYSYFPALRKPVLAALNGATVGVGLVHAVYCDVRFAADTATFSTAFARRGFVAENGISWILPRLVGVQNALDLLFSGRSIGADEALQMGLVARVVPANQLLEAVQEYAREIAQNCSPASIASMKKQTYEDLLSGLDPAYRRSAELVAESLKSADFREGVMSFVEKRSPAFAGLA